MKKYLNLSSYINFIINKLLIYTKPVIDFLERNKIQRYSSLSLKHQPIFIIGAPRTGSTILYQSLTNQFDVLYIDNLVCKFYKNIYFGFWLSNLFYKSKPHNSFKSIHGRTSGLHSPSECGSFWYRWFPKDRHFVDFDDLNDSAINEIRNEISAVINRYDKPIVFKNLNAGQRLRVLSKCFPDAKLIFCERNPFFTTQSILKAKRRVGIPDNEFWSIMPSNVDKLKKLDWHEQIVGQIYFLEKQINEDSGLFGKDSLVSVNYSELSIDKLNEIGVKLNFKNRGLHKTPEININEKIGLSDNEVKLIEEQINIYF